MWANKASVFFFGFVFVAGCFGQKKTDVETIGADDPIPQSTDNLDTTLAQFMRTRKLETLPIDAVASIPELPQMGDPDPLKWQSKSVGQAGKLLQRDQKANVIFAGPRCMRGSSCGCTTPMRHFFGKAAEGHIVIVEPKPNVHTRTVIRPGSCGYGCGQPSPPQPPAYFELPVNDMTLVEFVELPFELWDVVVTCEDPTPRP